MADECEFCRIAEGRDENTVLVYSDDTCVAFKDIRPVADYHYLVIPHEHIRTIEYISYDSAKPLLEHMKKVGHQVLQKILTEAGVDFKEAEARLGFHWPPYISVWHLHMHCIYPGNGIYCDWDRQVFTPNSSAFSSVEETLERIEGRKPKRRK